MTEITDMNYVRGQTLLVNPPGLAWCDRARLVWEEEEYDHVAVSYTHLTLPTKRIV